MTKGSLDVVSEPDRLARDTDAEDAIEITPEMISVGVAALKAYDPEREEPEALVFAILYRAFTIAVRNAKAAMAPLAE